MNQFKKAVIMVSLFLLSSLLFIQSASAYIDPGTGSMVVQIVVAGMISASVAIRIFWRKIKSIFTKKKD